MFKYRAIQGFQAEGPGEMSINAGEILVAQDNTPMDGWIDVKSLSSGNQGFVPFGYLDLVKQPDTSSDASSQGMLSMQSGPMSNSFGQMANVTSYNHLASAGQEPPSATSYNPLASPSDHSTYDMMGSPNTPGSYGQSPMTGDQFNAPPPALNPSIQGSNPFDQMGSMANSLPPTTTSSSSSSSSSSSMTSNSSARSPPPQIPSSQNDASKRHSYAMNQAPQQQMQNVQDQYKVTNRAQFDETLELWRERERRFLKGEPERLPQSKKREYFFWTRNGQRVGPLTEEDMRRRFDTRELSLDTPVALSVENEEPRAVQLQEYFPSVQDAFQTVPKVEKPGEIMWVYLDDMGLVQGPFSSKQMRDWFQDGYFNEFSKVKLANSGDDLFMQLGLLFPEGQGAFLSEGDQAGAKARQREIDAQGSFRNVGSMGYAGMTAPSDGSFRQGGSQQFGSDNIASPYDPNNPYGMGSSAMYGNTGQPPFGAYDPNNPFGGSGSDNLGGYTPSSSMPPPAWGAPNSSSQYDPFGAPDSGGKALLMRALSGEEQRPGVPPALGATSAGGIPPPPAMQPPQDDDWGVHWSDEEDEYPIKGVQKGHAEDNPLTVAEMDDDEGQKPPKVTKFSELNERYLSSVDSLYLFLTRCLPKKLGTIRCKIKRSVVGLHVNYNVYEVFLEKDDGSLGPQIMCARKHRKFGIDSFYNLEIGTVNTRECGKVISALIFNSLGTNFVCHNNVSAHKGKPRDLCCIVYARNVGRGPRKFQVALPALKENSETEMVEWSHQGSVRRSKMLQSLNTLDFPNLQPLVNKKPTWSKKHRAWVLNFHGRVTRSSVKNFQLVRPDNNDDVVLQFGRVGTDTFTMDMSWPISPVTALAVCVSSLHSKLAVE